MHANSLDVRDPEYRRLYLSALLQVSNAATKARPEVWPIFSGMALSHASTLGSGLDAVLSLLNPQFVELGNQQVEVVARASSEYRGEPFGSDHSLEVDLFILTVKRVELCATLAAFGHPMTEIATLEPSYEDPRTKRGVWLVEHEDYRIAIGEMDRDGLVEAAVAMSKYSDFVRFSRACLIGMAGGDKKSLSLGSVVLATRLHDYDRRIELGGIPGTEEGEETPKPIRIPERRDVAVPLADRHDFSVLIPESEEWKEHVSSSMPNPLDIPALPAKFKDELQRNDTARPDAFTPWQIVRKPIICGGALIEKAAAYAALTRLYNREAVAVDMESYGFAAWCQEHLDAESWLVIRGISDHCEQGTDEALDLLAVPDTFVHPHDDVHNVKKGDEKIMERSARRKDVQFIATYRAAFLLKDRLLSKWLASES